MSDPTETEESTETETDELTLYGADSRAETIIVPKNGNLKDVRYAVESKWSILKTRDLITGGENFSELAFAKKDGGGIQIPKDEEEATPFQQDDCEWLLTEAKEMPEPGKTKAITLTGGADPNSPMTRTIIVPEDAKLQDVRANIAGQLTLAELGELIGIRNSNKWQKSIPMVFTKGAEHKHIPVDYEENESVGSQQEWRIAEPETRSTDSFGRFLLGFIGWNPADWFYSEIEEFKEEKKCSMRLFHLNFFILFFVIDLFDTVVDLATAFLAIGESDDGGSKGLGIVLLVATICARLLSGWYGVTYNQIIDSGEYDSNQIIVAYFFVEYAVFYLEDGAATLYLIHALSDGRELDLLERINVYLTIICGFSCLVYIIANLKSTTIALTESFRSCQCRCCREQYVRWIVGFIALGTVMAPAIVMIVGLLRTFWGNFLQTEVPIFNIVTYSIFSITMAWVACCYVEFVLKSKHGGNTIFRKCLPWFQILFCAIWIPIATVHNNAINAAIYNN